MLKDLLIKNRSYRNFDNSVKISENELKELVEYARYCATGANRQALRYRLVCEDSETEQLHNLVKYAALLKDLDLPYKGNEAAAYILICAESTNPAPHQVNLGIAAQTILLAAAEKGYGGCMIGSFDKEKTAQVLSVDGRYMPLLVLAIGKPKETCIIKDVNIGESIDYYRTADDVHVVPKIVAEDIIL